MSILRAFILTAASLATLFAQYKAAPADAPPAEASGFLKALAPQGVKVLKPDGSVLCEMWFAASVGKEAAAEQNATWGIAHGSFLGIVRVPARWSDRRGQTIKPGFYTMRISFFPMNGDHQGVAPQRDFAILSPAAIDADATSKPAFDPLMDMSRKASGTPHPLVLSLWKESSPIELSVEAQGETDLVLHASVAGAPVSIIVVGKSDH